MTQQFPGQILILINYFSCNIIRPNKKKKEDRKKDKITRNKFSVYKELSSENVHLINQKHRRGKSGKFFVWLKEDKEGEEHKIQIFNEINIYNQNSEHWRSTGTNCNCTDKK